MEQTKFTRFKRITLIIFISIVFIFGLYMTKCTGAVVHKNTQEPIKTEEIIDTISKIEISKRDSIKEVLIAEVSKYLKRQSPNAHIFIPKYIVQAGLNYDIDICFMMAQTQLETNFGTLGAGREKSRRSMFGVAIRKYSNYEEAINDYCKLLHKSYLGKGRTEKHLMTKYVTHKGARYAQNPLYEADLSKTYKDIIRKTNIHDLQQLWKKSI